MHIRRICIYGIADGAFGSVVRRNNIHKPAHAAGPQLLRRIHKLRFSHKIKHIVLASGIIVALIGNYRLVISAKLAPIGDFSRIYVFYLLLRKAFYRIFCINKKHKGFFYHRNLLKLYSRFVRHFLLFLGNRR